MSTPVLTDQQQKKAIINKKKIKKVMRNALCLPYESYWPVLRSEKIEDFNDNLNSILTAVKVPKKSIPFRKLKHMSWAEVKETRRATKEEVKPEMRALRNLVLTGVSSITKALERNDICCVLLTDDVEPRDLLRHVAVMCASRQVPVLVVPSLCPVIQRSMGFSSITLGLKKCVAKEEGNYFHGLYQTIRELSAEYPITVPLTLFQNYIEEPSGNKEDLDGRPSKPAPQPEIQSPASIYKYRTSSKERAFVPGEVTVPQPSSQNDFMSINAASPDVEDNMESLSEPAGISHNVIQRLRTQGNTHKIQYITPVIKRLQPNPNKEKRKKTKKQPLPN